MRDAELWSVLAWVPQGGQSFNRRFPDRYLLRLWERDAVQRLRVAWDEALGGVPVDLSARLFVGRGCAGEVLVRAVRDEDLLVVGAGPSNPVRCALGGAVAGYCVRRAGCCVLSVPRSPLQARFGLAPLTRYLTRRKIVRDLRHHRDLAGRGVVR